MSELTLFLIKISYLAILWIFVLSAISVVRSDMFGARIAQAARDGARPAPSRAASPSPEPRRGRRPTSWSSTAPTPASAPSSPRPRS